MKRITYGILAIGILALGSCKNDSTTSKTTEEKDKQCLRDSQTKKQNMDNAELQFGYTILYVKDVEKSIDFYSNVFGFEKKYITPEKDYGEVHTGQTTLGFSSFELGDANFTEEGYQKTDVNDRPFGFQLSLTTHHVQESLDRAVENGATLVMKKTKKEWGQTVSMVRDLDGFLIEICTPVPSQE